MKASSSHLNVLLMFIVGFSVSSNARAGFGDLMNSVSNAAKEAVPEKAVPKTVAQKTQTSGRSFEPSQGITGPLHQKYLNSLVLDTKPVEMSAVRDGNRVSRPKFKLGETVYGRVFLDRPLAAHMINFQGNKTDNLNGSGEANTMTWLEVDGKNILPGERPVDASTFNSKDAKSGKHMTTFQTFILRSPEDKGMDEDLVAALNTLSVGDHPARVKVWAGEFENRGDQPIATIDFVLSVPPGGAKVKMGKSFAALPTGMKNAALETEILKLAKEEAGAEWGTPKKVRIESRDWTIERHPLTGVVQARKLSAWLYSVSPEGRCTYQSLGFAQDHDGKNFLKTYHDGFTSEHLPCDCD